MNVPERYETEKRLGKGGGGEVYAVRDRVTGKRLALKALAPGSGETEDRALVREAVALSALDGLGLPKIVGFGTLPSGERYICLLYTSPSPRDRTRSRMPSSA